MRKDVYKGKYITCSIEDIDGHLYERVTLCSGVRVLPVQDDGKILFIQEYRQHEKKSRLKLIGGWIDKNNMTALQVAQEELREEVSMKAKTWSLFYTNDTKNCTIEEHVDYFIARDIQRVSQQKNPDNDIVESVVYLDQRDVLKKLEQKELLWDKDMMVVLMFFNFKKQV
ncbi:MAG: hypothetical protein CR972_01865 [Candidatus Moraniibacteriota bacterium]|nr:MAG: hypothetical protein CR972_01865 [Candidatus Moranbacteria bacterium]